MKLTIDEKKCLKHKMTLTEVLAALSVRTAKDYEGMMENLFNREIIVQRNDKTLVTQPWSDVLDEIIAESSGSTMSEDSLKALAKKMIDNYPHGVMIDRRTGRPTTFYFQCNNYEVRAKLKSFFARYGFHSEEELLDAEKRYVARWNGNYQQPGFRQLKYFIFKVDKDTGEISSPLLDFLENKESEGGVEVTNSDDWLMNSRN